MLTQEAIDHVFEIALPYFQEEVKKVLERAKKKYTVETCSVIWDKEDLLNLLEDDVINHFFRKGG
jgi:hypothetical protein